MYRVENIIYVQSGEYNLCTEMRILFMYRYREYQLCTDIESIIYVQSREYQLCTDLILFMYRIENISYALI